MARNLRCQICSTFYSLTVALMLSHLLKVHRNDPDFFVKCDIPGCQRTFKNVHTYKSHLSRHHKGVNIRQPVRFFEGSATGPTVEGMDFEMEDALPEDHYNDSEIPFLVLYVKNEVAAIIVRVYMPIFAGNPREDSHIKVKGLLVGKLTIYYLNS